MLWFTADEHYNHANIIRYCDRPFSDVEEMNDAMIHRNNRIVKPGDRVYHLGDFIMGDNDAAREIISHLVGQHIFIKGSHDKWLPKTHPMLMEIYVCDEKLIPGTKIPSAVTLCHYAMRMWSRSHYGAIQLYGHSHGRLKPQGRQMDVGVDCWGYGPVNFDAVLNQLVKTPAYDAELDCNGEKEMI
jgi:calcineurin-like phosphoesterase family protein